MKYQIITLQNAKGQSLYVPRKKYPFWPFWVTFTTDIYSSGTIGDAQFMSFQSAKDFIKDQRDGKWYRLNRAIDIN